MDFKYRISEKVYSKVDSCICEHVVTAISFDSASTVYKCDDIVYVQEKDLYSDYDECKKSLIFDIEKKLKELQV